MARVLGVGGVFFKSRDPGEPAAWHQRCLGAPVTPSFGYGRFGWFLDPDANKVELWEPRPAAPGKAGA